MLLENSVLDRAQGVEALVKMIVSNNRLPQKECIRKINRVGRIYTNALVAWWNAICNLSLRVPI